jgi:hypothetical protein
MLKTTLTFALALLALGCGNDSVKSEADARKAYLGLDASIDKAINLGFDGFNAATSANIPDQMTTGTISGTLTVSGQVDQGASTNKTMRLYTNYVMYRDLDDSTKNKTVYDADPAALPYLQMDLKNIPTGTLTGSLTGSLNMSVDLKGKVSLALMFTGTLQAGPNNTVVRAPGSTHITGTATSDYGTYTVDVTR